jgi:hypothetical protein
LTTLPNCATLALNITLNLRFRYPCIGARGGVRH